MTEFTFNSKALDNLKGKVVIVTGISTFESLVDVKAVQAELEKGQLNISAHMEQR
jgi:hypothetical protein